jgi:hypothetical protein
LTEAIMGDTFRVGDVGGSGQVNIGRGGSNYQDNSSHQTIDNRGGTYVGGNVTAAPPGLLNDLDALGAMLEQLRLTGDERAEAERQLGAARAAVENEPQQAADPLRRFTEILKGAGALATAGAALVGPLTRIGQWLGPVGAAVLQLL